MFSTNCSSCQVTASSLHSNPGSAFDYTNPESSKMYRNWGMIRMHDVPCSICAISLCIPSVHLKAISTAPPSDDSDWLHFLFAANRLVLVEILFSILLEKKALNCATDMKRYDSVRISMVLPAFLSFVTWIF